MPSRRKSGMKMRTVLLALACCLTAAAQSAHVQAQGAPPPGSYRQTCKDVKFIDGHYLEARCREKNSLYMITGLRFVFLCDGDIWNNDGRLGCNKSPESPRFKAAAAAFDSASRVALGRAAKGTDMRDGGGEDVSEVLKWIAAMHAAGKGQVYQDGVRYSDAVAVLKVLYAKEIISDALHHVYGYMTKEMHDEWRNGFLVKPTTYTSIVNFEKARLKTDKARRTGLITHVYQISMGRAPNQSDLDYWLPREALYGEMKEACRAYLYSPNGRKDLEETIARALKVKTGLEPFPQMMVEAASKFTATKALYYEMIRTHP
jgi:hypothetical protein